MILLLWLLLAVWFVLGLLVGYVFGWSRGRRLMAGEVLRVQDMAVALEAETAACPLAGFHGTQQAVSGGF